MSKATVENISTIKTLFEGFEVSPEAVENLSGLLAEHLASFKEKILDEAVKEKIEISQKLTEAEQAVENLSNEKDHIMEKAEEYGEMLIEKAEEYGEMLKEQFEAEKQQIIDKAEEYHQVVAEEQAENLEKYAQYVVEQFVDANKGKLIEERNFIRMQNAFNAIKETLQEHQIELEPTDEYARLVEEAETRKTKYNELMGEYSALKEQMQKAEYSNILEGKISELADTQKEKVKQMLESVQFKDKDEYSRAVNLVILEVKGDVKADGAQLLNSDPEQKATTKVQTKYSMTDFSSEMMSSRQPGDFQERMNQYLKIM